MRLCAPGEVAALEQQQRRGSSEGGDAPGDLRAVRWQAGSGAALTTSLLLRLIDGWLALDSVQLEARSAQSGADFARGYAVAAGRCRLVNPPLKTDFELSSLSGAYEELNSPLIAAAAAASRSGRSSGGGSGVAASAAAADSKNHASLPF